jgi:prepilin-type processing-associated H-X9-DG protein
MKRARIQLLVGVLIAVILAGLGIAGLVRERELAARTRCRDNMRQIGLSLDCYYDACGGVYPSGTVTIKRHQWGKNLPPEQRLSWAIILHPYLDQSALYSTYNLNSPWFAPENEWFFKERVPWLLCPAFPESSIPRSPPYPTHYVGIAGLGLDSPLLPLNLPRAGFFGYDREIRKSDVKDGLGNTLVMAEITEDIGPWLAGGPSTVWGLGQGKFPYLGHPAQFGGFHRGFMTNVLFADGSVRLLGPETSPQVLEAMTTIAGGD